MRAAHLGQVHGDGGLRRGGGDSDGGGVGEIWWGRREDRFEDVGRLGAILFRKLGEGATGEAGVGVGSDEGAEEETHVERVPAEGVVGGGLVGCTLGDLERLGLWVCLRLRLGLRVDMGMGMTMRSRDSIHGKTIGHAKLIPRPGIHRQVFKAGKVGSLDVGVGLGLISHGGFTAALKLLDRLEQDVVLLAQFGRLQRVGTDHLVFLHVHVLQVGGDLLLLGDPLVLLAHQLGFALLQTRDYILELTDGMGIVFFLLFEFFRMQFFALARIETVIRRG